VGGRKKKRKTLGVLPSGRESARAKARYEGINSLFQRRKGDLRLPGDLGNSGRMRVASEPTVFFVRKVACKKKREKTKNLPPLRRRRSLSSS